MARRDRLYTGPVQSLPELDSLSFTRVLLRSQLITVPSDWAGVEAACSQPLRSLRTRCSVERVATLRSEVLLSRRVSTQNTRTAHSTQCATADVTEKRVQIAILLLF